MAFVWIADEAEMMQDDGSWSSSTLTHLHRNVEAIATERLPAIGVSYPVGSEPRLCSPWPMAHGPYWIYLHEPFASITVKVSHGGEVSTAAGLSIYVSCGSAREVDTPPRDRENWAASAAGATIAASASAAIQTLTASTNGRRGWIAVYLWTWSSINTTAESTGTITDYNAIGGVELTHGSGTVVGSTNPPERAFILSAAGPQIAASPAGPIRLIGGWDDDFHGGDDLVYTIPPILPGARDDTDSEYSIHKLGTLKIAGLSFRAVQTSYNSPSIDAYYADEPIKDVSIMKLVRGLVTMVSARRPQWVCNPGLIKEPVGDTLRPWLIRRSSSSPDEKLDGTFRSLAACVAAEPPADVNGHRAIVSLVLISQLATAAEVVDATLQIRIKAINIATGSTIATGATSTFQGVPIHRPFDTGQVIMGTWLPITQTVWGSNAYGAWQARGAFPPTDQGLEWASDILTQQHFEIEIVETSITYPCALVIEATIDQDVTDATTRMATECVVTGCGIVSMGLDD